jgi:creatinine amidohydrolase
MKRYLYLGLVCLSLPLLVAAQEDELRFRRMDYYCWQEFREVVPERCNTVILGVGTQEAHGVAANGTDAIIAEYLAMEVAPKVNALVAPTIPYGYTTSLSAYPGALAISPDTLKAYCLETVDGLAHCGFKNIIIFNGHGPNRTPLNEVAAEVSAKRGVRVLVVDWWSYCDDVTKEIWGAGEDGGHAALNENAAMQAIDPGFVNQRYYKPEMTVVSTTTYTAYPHPGTMILYSKGKGYPDFDQAKADKYMQRVVEELAKLIVDTRRRWDEAGL